MLNGSFEHRWPRQKWCMRLAIRVRQIFQTHSNSPICLQYLIQDSVCSGRWYWGSPILCTHTHLSDTIAILSAVYVSCKTRSKSYFVWLFPSRGPFLSLVTVSCRVALATIITHILCESFGKYVGFEFSSVAIHHIRKSRISSSRFIHR